MMYLVPRWRSAILCGLAAASAPTLTTLPAYAAAEPRTFDIAAGEAINTLPEFGRQAKLQTLFNYRLVRNLQTQAVNGDFEPEDALTRMLVGTGLTFARINRRTVAIHSAGDAGTDGPSERAHADKPVPTSTTAAPGAKGNARLAQAEQPVPQNTNDEKDEREKTRLGQMTVTGSHLSGVVQSASPLLVFDQADFDKAGAATAQQFLATLPQNFGGGQSDDTTNEAQLQFNPSFGTAVNLRGQGSSATLVLVNGRRSAVSGRAEYVDISMIPLSAVERIEILTDGASAIYGSDAIGGVVNFIMRKDYEGADTRLRGGVTTDGGAEEYQAAQSFGTQWGSGGVLLSYEYYLQESLSTLERDFSRTATTAFDGPLELVPRQERHNAYVSIQQEVLDRIEVSADVLYADRDAEYVDWNPFARELNPAWADNRQYSGSLGAILDLGNSWQFDVAGVLSGNRIDFLGISPVEGGAFPSETKYDLWSADAKLTGDLFHLPGGSVKLGVGASYRDESYDFVDNFNAFENAFNVRAAYAELLVPIASPLLLTLAGRYEEHSAFAPDTRSKVWPCLEAIGDAVASRSLRHFIQGTIRLSVE